MSPLRAVRTGIAMIIMLGITACGAAQTIHDSTVDAAKRVFTTPIPTMNLDLIHQAVDGSGTTIVRVYQLRSTHAFEALTDAQWVSNDLTTLQPDLLVTDNAVLAAGTSQSFRSPMHEHTQVVGVVAWRPNGDAKPNKLLIQKKQWAAADPVTVLIGNEIQMVQDAHLNRPTR
jgi:type VI secretion system protein VasD